MKHKLNGLDRVLIPNFIPPMGSIQDQTIIRDVLEKLKLTEEEEAHFGIVTYEGKVTKWDKKKILEEKEFDLSKTETTFLQDVVEKMDKEKKVTQLNLDTCLKIKSMR